MYLVRLHTKHDDLFSIVKAVLMAENRKEAESKLLEHPFVKFRLMFMKIKDNEIRLITEEYEDILVL